MLLQWSLYCNTVCINHSYIQYFLFLSVAPTVSVSDITVTRVNDTAVMITWTALTLNEARGFPSYMVTATNEGEQVSSQRTTSTSVMVGGLMPHTEYNITVQALTAGGTKEGPLSAPGETDSREHVRHTQLMLYRPHVHVL